jgi:hypothetical protein
MHERVCTSEFIVYVMQGGARRGEECIALTGAAQQNLVNWQALEMGKHFVISLGIIAAFA